MRYTQSFGSTLRETPSGAALVSHQLLLKAGFIHPITPVDHVYLPLALRTVTRIQTLLRLEMIALDGQECQLPFSPVDHDGQTLSAWRVIQQLADQEIKSYRQLPRFIFQFTIRPRAHPQSRSGLVDTRAYLSFEGYLFHRNAESRQASFQAIEEGFFRFFDRCGIAENIQLAQSDLPGGDESQAVLYLTQHGEDVLLRCDACDYAALQAVARSRILQPPPEEPLPIEPVSTPSVTSIDMLAAYLHIPTSKTAKAVLLNATLQESEHTRQQKPLLIFCLLRGDQTLNETKLKRAILLATKRVVGDLRPATDAEIRAIGSVPGYASPIGIDRTDVMVVVDEQVMAAPNLVAGANQSDTHLRNTNAGRDYIPDLVADIAQANAGDTCPSCSGNLISCKAIGLAQLTRSVPTTDEAVYLDEDSQSTPIRMGSASLDLSRLLACIVETHHDQNGLALPASVAPYPIHLVALSSQDPSVIEIADAFYQNLIGVGLEPLYDDRDERAGVKFNDADLIGLPLRITISRRSLENGGFEFKQRDREERWIVTAERAIDAIRDLI